MVAAAGAQMHAPLKRWADTCAVGEFQLGMISCIQASYMPASTLQLSLCLGIHGSRVCRAMQGAVAGDGKLCMGNSASPW